MTTHPIEDSEELTYAKTLRTIVCECISTIQDGPDCLSVSGDDEVNEALALLERAERRLTEAIFDFDFAEKDNPHRVGGPR